VLVPAHGVVRDAGAGDGVAVARMASPDVVARSSRGGPSGLALRWSARVDGSLAGALNMARDHALALELAHGAALLRLYRWDVPTLSLGRNEPAVGRLDPERARRLGVAVVRRPTGGRTVLHWRELTYAALIPAAAAGPREAYRWINSRLAVALASLGVPAKIADVSAPAARPAAGPCLRSAAPGELEVEGRKLVGSAQARIRGSAGDVLLQHGSILIENDQGLLEDLGIPGAVGQPATLAALLPRPLAEGELEAALVTAFDACADERPPVSRVERELERRYRSESWTWRR
jgi:lipoyl(octanoyl) transferase